MAFSHGVKATLQVEATNLEGYAESTSMDLRRELAEIRVLDSAAVQRLAGLRDVTFTAEGPFDPTADAALFAAWNGDTPVTVTYKPDGAVTYTANCLVESYNISASSGDKCTYSVNLSGTGAVSRT